MHMIILMGFLRELYRNLGIQIGKYSSIMENCALHVVYTLAIMRYTSLENLFVFWLCLEENASENYL